MGKQKSHLPEHEGVLKVLPLEFNALPPFTSRKKIYEK
jgi:hypothetical protein